MKNEVMMMTMTMISAIKVMMNKAILIPQHLSLQDNLSEHIDDDDDGDHHDDHDGEQDGDHDHDDDDHDDCFPQHLSLQDPHRQGNSSLGDWSVHQNS